LPEPIRRAVLALIDAAASEEVIAQALTAVTD
jgi:hypothetical protein